MNTLGYYGVFLGLQYQHDAALGQQLDADQFDQSQAVTIQVPLTVPYMYNDTEFKRAEGTFEHNGESYRLVKQKYADDTLTMICVRDTENERIKDALSDYVMSFTDNAGDERQNSTLTVSFIKDYLPQTFSILTSSSGWQTEVINNTTAGNLIPTFTASVIHPPERA
jgi:hypothetical protein